MEIGVVFPQTELGGDRGAVRAYGQAVADLGYAHVAAYDHVLGADTAVHGDIGGPYDVHDTFHEPLMLFSYLAGFTRAALRHLDPDRSPAPDRPPGQAGGGARHLVRWDVPARVGHRVEPRGVRGARLLVRRPGRLLGGAGGRAAPALDARERDRGRPLPPHHGGRAGPTPRPASHSDLDRRVRSRGAPPGRAHRRWLVPHGPPGAGLDVALEAVAEGAREVGRDPSTIAFEGRVDYSAEDPAARRRARAALAGGGSRLRLGQHHARRARRESMHISPP